MPPNERSADLAMAPTPRLRYVDPHKRRGRLYLAVARLSATKAGAWFSVNIAWKVDPHLLKLTRGRFSTAAPLATALLESRGARTGQPRRNATLYFHDRDRVTIIASKRGWPTNPAWYYNLCKHPDVIFAACRSAPRSSRTRPSGNDCGILPTVSSLRTPTTASRPARPDVSFRSFSWFLASSPGLLTSSALGGVSPSARHCCFRVTSERVSGS